MRQERIEFVSATDNLLCYGFLDPAFVLRRAHIIPAFNFGKTESLLAPSTFARVNPNESATEDYVAFYMNRLVAHFSIMSRNAYPTRRFANRDLYIHHHGGVIGQKDIRTGPPSAYEVSRTLFKRAGFDPRDGELGISGDDDDDDGAGADIPLTAIASDGEVLYDEECEAGGSGRGFGIASGDWDWGCNF